MKAHTRARATNDKNRQLQMSQQFEHYRLDQIAWGNNDNVNPDIKPIRKLPLPKIRYLCVFCHRLLRKGAKHSLRCFRPRRAESQCSSPSMTASSPASPFPTRYDTLLPSTSMLEFCPPARMGFSLHVLGFEPKVFETKRTLPKPQYTPTRFLGE